MEISGSGSEWRKLKHLTSWGGGGRGARARPGYKASSQPPSSQLPVRAATDIKIKGLAQSAWWHWQNSRLTLMSLTWANYIFHRPCRGDWRCQWVFRDDGDWDFSVLRFLSTCWPLWLQRAGRDLRSSGCCPGGHTDVSWFVPERKEAVTEAVVSASLLQMRLPCCPGLNARSDLTPALLGLRF